LRCCLPERSLSVQQQKASIASQSHKRASEIASEQLRRAAFALAAAPAQQGADNCRFLPDTCTEV
jgi:hypothetical protein